MDSQLGVWEQKYITGKESAYKGALNDAWNNGETKRRLSVMKYKI